jgi:hypothetical protein
MYVKCISCDASIWIANNTSGVDQFQSTTCSKCYYVNKRSALSGYYKEGIFKNELISFETLAVKPPLSHKVCSACKTEQKHQDALYCINCGADLFPKTKIEVKECPTCKTRYEMSDTFCDKDGTKLAIWEIEVDDDNPKVEVEKILSDSIDTERVNENDDNVNEKKPMKWYKFVTYVMCPLGIIISLYLSFIFNEYSEDIEAFSWSINAGFLGILLYGLHNRTTWSWKLLLGLYIMNGLFGRFEKLDEWDPFSYLIFVIFVMAITTYPNYIYFKKRGHFFQN